jgi:hypothetical protein
MEDVTFFTLKVTRCKESDAIECASDAELDEYLANMMVY